MPEILSSLALCSLADVKTYNGIATLDVEHDDLLTRLINAASEAITAFAGREFVGPVATQRFFDDEVIRRNRSYYVGPETIHLGYLSHDHEIYLGDLRSVTSYSVLDRDGNVVGSLLPAQVTLYPRNPKPGHPYTSLRLRQMPWGNDYTLAVTGSWGWPSVPQDVRQTAVVTASIWFARDIQNFSQTFNNETERLEMPRSLPPQVVDALRHYVRLNWS